MTWNLVHYRVTVILSATKTEDTAGGEFQLETEENTPIFFTDFGDDIFFFGGLFLFELE